MQRWLLLRNVDGIPSLKTPCILDDLAELAFKSRVRAAVFKLALGVGDKSAPQVAFQHQAAYGFSHSDMDLQRMPAPSAQTRLRTGRSKATVAVPARLHAAHLLSRVVDDDVVWQFLSLSDYCLARCGRKGNGSLYVPRVAAKMRGIRVVAGAPATPGRRAPSAG